ncbi:MAG: putative zinc-binding protein [Anaerolineae bacterium]
MSTTEKPSGTPETALFVCFGGMSNVGTLTGLAGLEVMKQLGRQKACIFCLGGLPTKAPTVLKATEGAQHIITVDGCSINCARKLVEAAGFTPDRSLTLVTDCGIPKKSLFDFTEEDVQKVVRAILEALEEIEADKAAEAQTAP